MAEPGDYSIRWFEEEMGPCVLCGDETGLGAVGWHRGDPTGPVCDACLADREPSLGAVVEAKKILRGLDPENGPDALRRIADASPELVPLRRLPRLTGNNGGHG